MSILGSNPRAPVDASHPQAQAICDRCGFLWHFDALQWQFQWRGTQLVNTRFLVCPDCLDVPQEQLRTIVLPPDPLPVLNARPPQWAAQEAEAGQLPTPAYVVPDDE